MKFEKPKGVSIHLDIAPLIDIVFQLLIFFMLTSTFITERGIPITLPQAETGEPQEERRAVVVSIDGEAQIFVDGEKVNFSELQNILAMRLLTGNTKTVVLHTDETASMGLVVRVIDIARRVKGEHLVIATRKSEDAASSGQR